MSSYCGDYMHYEDLNGSRHVRYSNIRVETHPSAEQYYVTWTIATGADERDTRDRRSVEKWIRDGTYVRKVPTMIRLPIGI